MRASKTLAKIRAKQTVKVCALGHFIPAFIQYAAHYGYDCIWLDLEHRSIDDRSVQLLLSHCHLYDIDCMVRPPTIERARLYRYLEDGATGLMIPHVSTVEKATGVAQAVKFPPVGDRGLDGAGFDSDYMLSTAEAYLEHANRETFLVVQIETPMAVEQVEAIAAVLGIDGMFVGPGDLGLRLKHTNDLDLLTCMSKVANAARQHGLFWGAPAGTVQQMKDLQNMGAQFLAHGGDFGAMVSGLKAFAHDFSELD